MFKKVSIVLVSALLAGVVVFSGCGDKNDDRDEMATSMVTSINVAVTDVPGDVKVVKLATSYGENVDGNPLLITLSPEGVFFDGKISIDLSVIVPPSNMLGGVDVVLSKSVIVSTYGEDISNSNKNAKIGFFEGLAAFDEDGENLLGWFRYGYDGSIAVEAAEFWVCFVYADSDVMVYGSSNTWRANFKKGWNFLCIEASSIGDTYVTAVSNLANWYFEAKTTLSE